MLRAVSVALAVSALWASGAFRGLVSAERDSRASLELVDRGYVNLLIGINDRVPNNPGLLDRIQFVFTKASKFLFQATKNRAYFKDIHILVPESWDDSADYSSVEWQRYDQSDVIVDYSGGDGQTSNNRPYTNKATPCGDPGQNIHLTPDYILSQATATPFGPYGKTLTHEWAHYRWGVFDEYPLENGDHFYADSNGNIEAVRCVLNIQGRRVLRGRSDTPCREDESGLPESDCRFLDDFSSTDYTGSIMYKQFLPAISTFCENAANGVPEGNTHNREAPNLQNIACQGKSVWEVMRRHRDFAGGKGENDVNGFGGDEDEFDGEPVPEFTVVKKRPSRIVLVLDTSGSMKGQRLRQLRQASEHLITQVLQDGEKLGIVEFAKSADILSELHTINNASRTILLEGVPNTASGWTSIGSGITLGLRVLQGTSRDSRSIAGGKIVIITDGEDNFPPKIEDVLHLVNGSGVTIDTVAVGPDASPYLELLSTITGGLAYSIKEESNSLSDVFSKVPTMHKAFAELPITVYSEFIQIPAGQRFSGAVYIDDSVGHRTTFEFGHSEAGSVAVNLTAPDGAVSTAASPNYHINADFQRIRIAIPGNAQVGLWTFDIRNNRREVENVTVLVQSHARGNQEPLLIRTYWRHATVVPPQIQSLYVAVGQGYTSVVGADVRAIVDHPCGNGSETVTLRPKDDGIGADIGKDDGVYSSYFTEFCGEGRYGVNIEVTNNGQVTSVVPGSVIGSGAAVNPESIGGDDSRYPAEPERRSTGDFRRVSIGGSFKCEGSSVCNGSVDMYPPSRITDLKATNVDPDTKQIKLVFTAPGDDLSTGRASHYIIVMSRSVSDIYDNFDSVPEVPWDSFVEGNVAEAKDVGETETFVIQVTETGAFSYAFAVVAIDDSGNQGETSNVVTSSARERQSLGLVIGVSIGGAVLVILVVIAAVCACRQRRGAGKKGTGPRSPEDAMGNGGATVDHRRENNQSPVPQHSDPARPGIGPQRPAMGPQRPPIGPQRPPSAALNAPGERPMPPSVPQKPSSVPQRPPSAALNAPGERPMPPSIPQKPSSVPQRPPTFPQRPPTFPQRPPSFPQRPPSSSLPADDVYEGVISRRETDPNWDPSLPNNSEGGGANIQTGHVANTRAAFDNIGFLK